VSHEQPLPRRDIGRATRLADARYELAKVVDELRRAGIADEEIKLAFVFAIMKDE
jgi:hypothetical protein